MQDEEIVAAIDEQISQLQKARALLTGGESVASTGKKRGRPEKFHSEDRRCLCPSSPRAGKRTMTPEGKARIAAAQRARWAAQKRIYTVAEHEQHQVPMNGALEPEDAAQFKWKGETGTVQTYQHIETVRNIHIDDKGLFYRQDGKLTSQEAALDRAMPRGRAHSQNEYENSLGLGR